MTQGNVFGSADLTPELVRSARFSERDGLIDATEVRDFLGQVASALEVLSATDTQQAVRNELSRNAEWVEQLLDAGQAASERLRTQAADDARRILEETREATVTLRETVEREIDQSREQVIEMRGQFIQDLRDLYDRIGASLYRFERAAEESQVEPITAPTHAAPLEAAPVEAAPAVEPVVEPAPPHPAPPASAFVLEDPPAVTGEQEPAPAWMQLPPEAWGAAPDAIADTVASELPAAPPPTAAPLAETPQPAEAAPTFAVDPFAVVEDEPLAPGEPLVDLRDLGGSTGPDTPIDLETEIERPEDDLGGSWLEPIGDAAAPAVPAAPAAPVAPTAEAAVADPAVTARDDALAEALIAGSPFPDAPSATEQTEVGAEIPSPPPAPVAPTPVAGLEASSDAAAVRHFILDSLASGQSRETVEAYLRDQLGLLAPGTLIDAALGTAGGQPPES